GGDVRRDAGTGAVGALVGPGIRSRRGLGSGGTVLGGALGAVRVHTAPGRAGTGGLVGALGRARLPVALPARPGTRLCSRLCLGLPRRPGGGAALPEPPLPGGGGRPDAGA